MIINRNYLDHTEGSKTFPRPKGLTHSPFEGLGVDNVTLRSKGMEASHVTVFAGISLEGEGGEILYRIGALQKIKNRTRGWVLRYAHPRQFFLNFHRIDTQQRFPPFEPFPQAYTYFVGHADDRYVQKDQPMREKIELIQFVSQFMSDCGPPDDIDW